MVEVCFGVFGGRPPYSVGQQARIIGYPGSLLQLQSVAAIRNLRSP
jgi:hypothetical protein